jgi:hypothetical protein
MKPRYLTIVDGLLLLAAMDALYQVTPEMLGLNWWRALLTCGDA